MEEGIETNPNKDRQIDREKGRKTVANKEKTKVLKIRISKKDYDKIINGEYTSTLIQRSKSNNRNTCFMTTAIHIFANSLWVIWDTIMYFHHSNGCITLDMNSVSCK